VFILVVLTEKSNAQVATKWDIKDGRVSRESRMPAPYIEFINTFYIFSLQSLAHKFHINAAPTMAMGGQP
jgi:hypothetical protein